jgi:hypothetical protein
MYEDAGERMFRPYTNTMTYSFRGIAVDLTNARTAVDRVEAAQRLYRAIVALNDKGYAIEGEMLNGFTVREIAQILSWSGKDRREFYLSGIGYEMNMHSKSGGEANNNFSGVYSRVRLNEFPMANVYVSHRGDSNSLDSLETSLRAYALGEEYNDPNNLLDFITEGFANEGVSGAYNTFGEPSRSTPGSSVTSIILEERVRLVRRNVLPAIYMARGNVQLRIAGFDKLIPWHSTELLSIEESLAKQLKAPTDGEGHLSRRNACTSSSNSSVYQVFVPGGEMNCVLASFSKGLEMCWIDDTDGQLPELFQRGEFALRADTLRKKAWDYVQEIYGYWKACEISQQVGQNVSYLQANGIIATRNMLNNRFDRRTKHGFSPTYLKRLIAYVLKECSILLEIYSLEPNPYEEISRNLWEVLRLKRSVLTEREVHELCSNVKYRIAIVEVDINGAVVTKNVTESLRGKLEGTDNPLIHAVNIHPHPCYNGNYRKGMFQLLTKTNVITDHLKRLFKRMLTMADYDELDCYSVPNELPKLIHFQNERQASIIQSFKEHFSQRNASSSSSSSSNFGYDESELSTEEEEALAVKRSKVVVIAYDLETVELLRGVQDVVSEKFRTKPPEVLEMNPPVDLNVYTTVEAQIPYSVQWGPVRLSSLEEEETSEKFVPILPEDVKVCLGDGKGLGECVVEFLDQLVAYCELKGVTKMYAYAHNGCGFDAYLIKTYNYKYPMKQILITPRGVLSMTIVLKKGVFLYLRDTKVHFGGALSDLCAVFNVPKPFRKTDFPITRIHARNCFDENVLSAAWEYMVNDVICLAYIIDGINRTIMHLDKVAKEVMNVGSIIRKADLSKWYTIETPPITQFVTIMSLVKQIQKQLFYVKLKMPTPIPVDIPALRKWISYANVGGRTTAYWRSFYSSQANAILETIICSDDRSFLDDNEKQLKSIYNTMCLNDDYVQVWDVTSLYPKALFDYPMPTVAEEPLAYLSPLQCEDILSQLHCLDCRFHCNLCPKHRCGGEKDLISLGFAFIFVKNVSYPSKDREENGMSHVNISPRKLAKGAGLVYSFQSNEELREYYGKVITLCETGGGEQQHQADAASSAPSSSAPQFPDVECYCMTDVYWLRESGYQFEVVGGVLFGTSYAFRESINTLFKERIKAKELEKEKNLPKCFSTLMKLIVNGWYGVWCQKNITDSYVIVPNFQSISKLYSDSVLSPDEEVILNTKTHLATNGDYLLNVRKLKGSCETYAPESACQVGAAVTSFSRHHMNLAMFDIACRGLIGYTDTDSMAIHGTAVREFRTDKGSSMYNESASAPLGTYKNDHEEGKGECVFLSLFVAKKVKLHMTLDAEGVIRVYPTFKGFNPSAIDPTTGVRLHPNIVLMQKAQAIVKAYFDGFLGEVTQTEFRRTVDKGIYIDKNAKFSASLQAFCGASGKGTYFKQVGGHSVVEYIVPHGGGDLLTDRIEHPFFENVSCCKLSEVRFDKEKHSAAVQERAGKYITEEGLLGFLKHYYMSAIPPYENSSLEMEGVEDDHLEKVFQNAPCLQESDYMWKNQ